MPVRKILARAGRAVQALKPCFMMGPQAVAQYLTPGAIAFDLVIMDEASQLKPEEAIGAIARGGQLVVVGDPKQLPPTSFFSRMNPTPDDDEQYATTDAESILDVCTSHFRPPRALRWHYRSQHHSLIAFSNRNFYRGNLIIFPSPYHQNIRPEEAFTRPISPTQSTTTRPTCAKRSAWSPLSPSISRAVPLTPSASSRSTSNSATSSLSYSTNACATCAARMSTGSGGPASNNHSSGDPASLAAVHQRVRRCPHASSACAHGARLLYAGHIGTRPSGTPRPRFYRPRGLAQKSRGVHSEAEASSGLNITSSYTYAISQYRRSGCHPRRRWVKPSRQRERLMPEITQVHARPARGRFGVRNGRALCELTGAGSGRTLERSFLRFRSRSRNRSRLRFFLMLDGRSMLRQPAPHPLGQLERIPRALLRRHLRQAMLERPRHVDLLPVAPLIGLAVAQPSDAAVVSGG